MCKNLSFFLFVFLWLCLSTDALRAEEPDNWYLISETELLSIEQYKTKSKQEKQNWLLQSHELKQDSASLNAQLAQARERNRKLEQSFNVLESEWLTQLSLKNGEIANLKQTTADKTLEAEKWKSKAIHLIFLLIIFLVVTACLIIIRIKRKN
jgi:hypothetical protein